MSGFTYNGIHSSTFGVEYIPDAAAKWWDGADFEIYKKKVSWKNGGYIYGSAANIRTIKMNCYFEEISIATREKIRKWLRMGAKGKLVFDDMPFVYYMVTLNNVVTGKIYLDTDESYSGTFTVEFVAEEPFGYLMRKSNTGTENDNAEDYCELIASSKMPAAPGTSDRVFDVYNPGTEPCGLHLKLAGTATGIFRFFNTRNNTECVINSLPTNNLTLDLNCDDSGMVKVYTGNNSESYDNGFAYHDHGMVRLEPCEMFENIGYTAAANGTMYDITPSGIVVDDDLIGAFIQFDNPATRNATVSAVNKSSGKLTCTVGGSGTMQMSGTMSISKMNHITIQSKNSGGNWVAPSGITLSKLEIDYSPRAL